MVKFPQPRKPNSVYQILHQWLIAICSFSFILLWITLEFVYYLHILSNDGSLIVFLPRHLPSKSVLLFALILFWASQHPFFFTFTVGYDVTYYNYLWIREPHLKTELHLDNHDVHISAFDFVAIKEDRQFPGLGVKVKLKRHLGR